MGDSPYKITKIAEDFYSVDEGGVRMFLIEGSDSALLIDCGFGTGELDKFVSSVTDKKVTVIITHSDGDHTGGLKYFAEAYMHPADFASFRERNPQHPAQLAEIWEGDVFQAGRYSFEAIHIPGHTPGSIVLYDRENKILISGDSIQQGPIFMFGSNRDTDALIASLKKLKMLDLDIDIICPSHNAVPLDSGYIDLVLEGAELLRQGKLEAKEAPERFEGMCSEYAYKEVSFYY